MKAKIKKMNAPRCDMCGYLLPSQAPANGHKCPECGYVRPTVFINRISNPAGCIFYLMMITSITCVILLVLDIARWHQFNTVEGLFWSLEEFYGNILHLFPGSFLLVALCFFYIATTVIVGIILQVLLVSDYVKKKIYFYMFVAQLFVFLSYEILLTMHTSTDWLTFLNVFLYWALT